MQSDASAMISEAKHAILEKAGKHVRLLVLYGSEARREATPESDIDLLVVLDVRDASAEQLMEDAVYDVMWKHGFPRLVSLCFMTAGDFQRQSQRGYSFVRNVEEEGIVLWQAA
ncbi:MAG: nucleotidyltransferase domain-containing protein [Chloroflexota bacterium]|nr:MAG: nucleotidyltransferase domain-containing protein [Chloroflexota bacterium]